MKRIVASLLLVSLITACGVRDVKYNPSHFRLSGVAAPPDVNLPAGVKPGDVVRGLHVLSATAPTEELCCWIDTHAAITVSKMAGQASLHIGAYIPDEGQFKSHPQKLKVIFADGRAIEVRLNHGMNAKIVSVPANIARQRGPLELQLSAASPYFPGGPSSKPLGVLLLSVYFE